MIGHRPAPLHPLAVAALPVAAILAVILADGVAVGLICLAVGVLVGMARGLRLGVEILATAVGMGAVLWTGFAVSLPVAASDTSRVVEWLPFAPTLDNALTALRGALRIVSIMVLLVATAAWIRWNVLGDTLIEHFGVPYRLVDVLSLGGRFAVLVRHDLRTARTIARLRTRGRPWLAARLLTGLMVPVLMGAFRHADELTIAMEARGFGALEERTTHHARRVRRADLFVVVLVWTLTLVCSIGLSQSAG